MPCHEEAKKHRRPRRRAKLNCALLRDRLCEGRESVQHCSTARTLCTRKQNEEVTPMFEHNMPPRDARASAGKRACPRMGDEKRGDDGPRGEEGGKDEETRTRGRRRRGTRTRGSRATLVPEREVQPPLTCAARRRVAKVTKSGFTSPAAAQELRFALHCSYRQSALPLAARRTRVAAATQLDRARSAPRPEQRRGRRASVGAGGQGGEGGQWGGRRIPPAAGW